MSFRFFSFLKFWITSSNQHGVHSPFIYHYVTKCLYAAPNFKMSKSHNILIKTIAYFKLTKVELIPGDIALEKEITKNLKGITIEQQAGQLIYIGILNNDATKKYIVENNDISNDTIIYIDDIYKSRETHNLWENIKELEQVKATIDLFYGGLVFFRREQEKEHFKIRI